MGLIGNIWTFSTRHLLVTVDAEVEVDPDFSWDTDGQTQVQVESGELECFIAVARVLYVGDDHEAQIGSDVLGNCIYKNYADFRKDHLAGNQGSYFRDMVCAAVEEARPRFDVLEHRRRMKLHCIEETLTEEVFRSEYDWIKDDVSFRRAVPADISTTALIEGVTPYSRGITYEVVQ